jgi:hypothetical protein
MPCAMVAGSDLRSSRRLAARPKHGTYTLVAASRSALTSTGSGAALLRLTAGDGAGEVAAAQPDSTAAQRNRASRPESDRVGLISASIRVRAAPAPKKTPPRGWPKGRGLQRGVRAVWQPAAASWHSRRRVNRSSSTTLPCLVLDPERRLGGNRVKGRHGRPLHCVPVRLARDGRSFQLGRASAPTIPQPVHTMRAPRDVAGAIGVMGWASSAISCR